MSASASAQLLDRRALALLHLLDAYGRPVDGPVRIEGAAGLRIAAKGQGRFAILSARGLEAHAAAFETPSAPPPLSHEIRIDLTPAARAVAPRSLTLRLPRHSDPAHAHSVFAPLAVAMPPSATAQLIGGAGSVRVCVTHAGDGRLVEGALVRCRSDDGRFEALGVTDARGEAHILFPSLPLAGPGGGASLQAEIAARAVAHADPATARLHAPQDTLPAIRAAALRVADHPDPDALAAAFPADFASGTPVILAAGRQAALSLSWAAP